MIFNATLIITLPFKKYWHDFEDVLMVLYTVDRICDSTTHFREKLRELRLRQNDGFYIKSACTPFSIKCFITLIGIFSLFKVL